MLLPKTWLKGRFNFWLITKNYMSNRDRLVARHFHDLGVMSERKRILKRMNDYFELTQFSEQYEKAKPNPEWDKGYQAAMAIAKGEDK